MNRNVEVDRGEVGAGASDLSLVEHLELVRALVCLLFSSYDQDGHIDRDVANHVELLVADLAPRIKELPAKGELEEIPF